MGTMRFSSALIPFLSSLSWTSVTMAAREDPTCTTMTASNRDDEDFGKNNHASNRDDEVFEYWRILVDTAGSMSMTTNAPTAAPSGTPTTKSQKKKSKKSKKKQEKKKSKTGEASLLI